MTPAYSTPSPGGRQDIRAAAHGLLDALAERGGIATRATAERHHDRLEEPIQIGVGGRVSAGKSTLVNALIGARVAPTAARELTAFLTAYHFGLPPRAEAHLRDGTTAPVPLTPSGPDVTGLVPQDVVHLSVHLPQAALRRFTFVDTPGLGSAVTTHGQRTEAALLNGEIPELRPEVLLYAVRDTMREDDLAFVSRFAKDSDGTRSRVTTVAVLCHADSYGSGAWGEDDPLVLAQTFAEHIPDRVPSIQAGIAVCGLLAESARAGTLKDQDVRVLGQLVGAADSDLQLAAHLGPPAGVSAAAFNRLTELLGAYGIRHGRDHVERSPAALRDWMDEVSGVARLESLIHGIIVVRTDCLRVDRMFTELLAEAHRERWSAELTGLVEQARYSAPFHPLDEWRAWESLRNSEPGHELVADLERLLAEGPDGGADESDPLARATHYQSIASTTSRASVAAAARVLSRSMALRSLEASR